MTQGAIGDLDPQHVEYADQIQKAGTHLLQVINDILDLSRIETGTVALEETVFDPAATIGGCLELVRERARQGDVALSAELPDELPLLEADERKIKQILINLLSNAVKFTPHGGAVTVKAAMSDDGGLAILVSDNGIGMRPSEIPVALAAFQQIDSRLARNFEGTGLGLPLSQSLAGLHGGTIGIESALGEGTTVTLALPAARIRERGQNRRKGRHTA
jgi:signal transduction histidine kinase